MPEDGDEATCHCGQPIVWRAWAPLPFPEVATRRQVERRAKKGRWLHENEHTGERFAWCPPQKPYPKPYPADPGGDPHE